MSNEDDDAEPTAIDILRSQVGQEGYSAGSPEFERRFDQMRVQKCREMRGFPVCTDCPVFDFCELVKKVMRSNQGFTE